MKETPNSSYGPDPLPAQRRWTVEWQGTRADLWVSMSWPGRFNSVQVNGIEVGRFLRPTLGSPWSECLLTQTSPSIKVVQIAFRRHRYRTLLFVDGVSADDGRSEAEWRAGAPRAMDAFESQMAGTRLLGRPGALAMGLMMAVPFVLYGIFRRDPTALAIGTIGFGVGYGWIAGIAALIRWLVPRRSWPSPIRRLMVAFAGGVVPIIAILIAKALTGAR